MSRADYLESAKSLGDLLLKACSFWKEHIAICYHNRSLEKPISYREYRQRVFYFARALFALGLKKGDRLALLAKNSLDWALIDWASQTLGVLLVPIYPTLPEDQVSYILKDCGASVLIVDSLEQASKAASVELIKVVSIQKTGDLEWIETFALQSHLQEQEWQKIAESVEKNDVATIIYTSGTTGNSKGVMLEHKSFLYLMQVVHKTLPIDEHKTFLCFLPLSHVYERTVGHFLPLALGATLGYVDSVTTFAKDMLAVRPHVMLCVPRFLESMKHRVEESLLKQSFLKRTLFALAYKQGLAKSKGKFAPLFGLTDCLVSKKIRERTGGRLEFFVSGGAALSKSVSDFFTAFGIVILQGYGLTETTSAISVNHPNRNDPVTVGEILEGMEVKIAEDGEILVRGPTVMRGYYHLPEETAKAIDSEGWFSTGDIGSMLDNKLRITDRKKDIIVLGNGKNVAPQPIEEALKSNFMIEEAVLFGDGMEHICALIVPKEDMLLKLAQSFNMDSLSKDKLIQEAKIKQYYQKEIKKMNAGLASFEKIKKFELLAETFSVQTGELTPSLKVKRKVIAERYIDKIKSMGRGA